MARTKKQEENKEEKKILTRAQKTDAAKNIVKELLAAKPMKHNELIDAAASKYAERYGDNTDNVNDVRGRVGSVLDTMQKSSEIMYDGGIYALKSRLPAPPAITEEKTDAPAPKKRGRKPTQKAEETPKAEAVKAETTEEKAETPKKKATKKTAQKTEGTIAPEAKTEETPKVAEEKAEVPAPKKRGRKPAKKAEEEPKAEEVKTEPAPEAKAEEKAEENKPETPVTPLPELEKVKEIKEIKAEQQPIVQNPPAVKEKGEVAKKSEVIDMSFLFGAVKTAKPQEKAEIRPVREAKTEMKTEEKAVSEKKEDKPAPAPKKAEAKPAKKAESKQVKATETKPERKPARESRSTRKTQERPMTADEKLRESFLKRMRVLGGDYFEYYSVYLLERYSMKNGRRLEGMKISGGDHDGGIDGEIELTDKLGFKETIYIQSKNWDPEKGKEENWVVGETLLQQFIGACACRQAKDGKQHCRGIFVTTSRFTPDAKHILDEMSDKIVGYDGNDLYEAAKECEFGLVKKGGEWTLDEKLLSGTKAFFNML